MVEAGQIGVRRHCGQFVCFSERTCFLSDQQCEEPLPTCAFFCANVICGHRRILLDGNG